MKRILIVILFLTASGYSSHQTPAQTEQTDEKVYDPKEVNSTVKVLSQPDPVYTNEAARQHVVGVVKMTAVFAGNGEIKNIQVINGLPAGLTEQAVASARQITFTPAMKDGHPVAQNMVLEYRFQLTERIIHGQQFPKLFYDERCRDYSNIAATNMVFFTSEKEAKKAGYKKSKTCP